MCGLTSMSIPELAGLMEELGQPKFRAKQVFEWISRGKRPQDMTNLPRELRDKLDTLHYGGASIYDKRVSAKDGTIKYLFQLEDGNIVEGVLMSYHYGNTMCISTQVGCRMGCAFCASTLEGCIRNLEAGEMLSFIACAEKDVPHGEDKKRTVTNIVLMGSGEPLDNYDEVVKFLRLVSAPEGMNISPRNISISTCGLVPQLMRFTKEAPHVTLSVSLHAPNDETRDRIMPINRKYRMAELLNAAKHYAEETGRRVIFEYALIKDVNSSERDAKELAARLRGINCHVNLIPLNHVEERNLTGVTRRDAEQFAAWLQGCGISATVRREMGSDIDGACGQLRRKTLQRERNAAKER